MPIVYFDSSAFVKLLIREDGSELASELWDGCDSAVSSQLAYPEVRAALAAASRARRLTAAGLAQAEILWERYWTATWQIDVNPGISFAAGELAGVHALRGADAVHLASALAVRDNDTVIAVWDQSLRAGALTEGFAVSP